MARFCSILNWLGRKADPLALTAVATAGACTLLGFAARHHWRLELISHFRVQYFWVLAVAVGVLAARRRFRTAMVGAVFALVNFVLIVPLYFGPDPPATDRPITRALSLNVHYYNRRYERTLKLIRDEEPDFVLLLEVTPDWIRALRVLYDRYPFSRLLPHGDSSVAALYSRLPIEPLMVPGQDDNRLPVKLVLPSGTLTLLCAHPPSPSSPLEFEVRNRQLEAIARWASAQRGPLMVLGDLNTTSWSPYFSDFLAVSGLSDSRLGFGVQGTWPSLPLPLRIPIDHCLVSASVAVCARRVGAAVGSDHRPIIVDFTIDPR